MPKLSTVNPNENIKLLVYGDSGTGKSCYATSFPTPIFVADFDNKIGSAAAFYAGNDRLEQIDFETYFPKGPGVQAGAAVFNEWSTKLYELEKLAKEGKFPYKTVVLDSLTLYADRMLEKVMCDNPAVKRYSPGVAVLQDYGILNPNFKQQLGRVLALPCNVVVCAHIKIDKDDLTGQLVRGPNLSPKLAAYLPILFYEVYHSYAEKKGDETLYFAQTKSDYQYQCRSQIRGLPSPIPLTYESLRKGE